MGFVKYQKGKTQQHVHVFNYDLANGQKGCVCGAVQGQAKS